MRGPGKFLDKESPIQGPWCRVRREEKREPASDINAVCVKAGRGSPTHEAPCQQYEYVCRKYG